MPPDPSDPRAPVSQVVIRDFGGLVLNSDPHDLPPGVARSLINVASLRPGELRVRLGFAIIRFD